MDYRGKQVLIVGLGRTGVALANFFKPRGANVTVTDVSTVDRLGPVVEQVRQMGIRVKLEPHRAETFTEADLVVLSPGVPHTLPAIETAKAAGVPVLGELELAARWIREPVIAVTGTNGKTTATTLLGDMMMHSGFKVFVGGNIGTPLISYMDRKESAQWVVVEISSFQLDTAERFRPRIGVLLNVTEDHQDRYANFDAYVRSKARLFMNQQAGDTAILNGSDPAVRRIGETVSARKWFVHARADREPGAVIGDAAISFYLPQLQRDLTLDRSASSLSGLHNAENIAAAALATLAAGGSIDGIRSALRTFRGLPHRLQTVAVRGGVRYVNDSKATNVDAVEKALGAVKAPVVLIMGGRDKGGDFRRLQDRIRERVKALILMGEAAPTIEAALGRSAPCRTVASLEDAVQSARQIAVAGDVVLLSPGCTSFDRYRNYAERGDMYSRAVGRLG